MINGDTALSNFDPNEVDANLRSEPSSEAVGPKKNDVIRVLIEDKLCVCTVLTTTTYSGRPLYRVQYDDGMIVEDHLSVPWNYVSVAPTSALDTLTSVANAMDTNSMTASAPGLAAAATAASKPIRASVETQPSAKALGKRRMDDTVDEKEPSAKALGKRRMCDALGIGKAPEIAPDVIAAYDNIEAISGINQAMSRENKYMTCLRMF